MTKATSTKAAGRVSHERLVAFAHELADASAAAILPHFRRPIRVENKAGADAVGHNTFDPVTKADRAAERVIRTRLDAAFPDHGILGEEYGERAGAGRYHWVVDPIDGTRAFIMGLPVWGTLIGLIEEGRPTLGLMNQPFTGERFWSARRASFATSPGRPARRIRTRACPSLAEATFSTTHPDMFAPGQEKRGFERVKAAARMTRYGGDCYAYCLLAAGHIDLVVESGLKPHDVVALVPIVEQAGGVMTTWDGGPAAAGGRIVAAGDSRLHEAALRLLAG